MFKVFINLCFLLTTVKGKEFNARQYATLPRLFDLGDYHGCMKQRNGVYCLGTFHLTPIEANNPVYNLMEEYSSNRFAFNRTLIHRGVCLNPHHLYPTNRTIQFEEYISEWANVNKMCAKLYKLDYCRSDVNIPDTSQMLFIYAILGIVLLNVVGTVGDTGSGKDKFRKIIRLWSIKDNWNRLTTVIYEKKDSRMSVFAPIQGARVIILAIFLLAHSNFAHYRTYFQNPEAIERDLAGFTGAFFANGTTVVQIFVIFSSMLCTYNILISSEKKPFLLSSIPKQILKRIMRTGPVHILLVGFGATYYAHTQDGPLWPALIETEQNDCRRKLWSHVLFINNFIEPENKCYLQSWFLAVDMQLYIATVLLLFLLFKIKHGILTILFILYISSLFFVSILAYINEWQSMLYIAVPETMHAYLDSPSFTRLYTSPFAHVPSCLVGIILAYLQYSIREDLKPNEWKWLRHTSFCIPTYIGWLLSGVYIRSSFTSPIATAAYVGLERLVFNALIGTVIFGTINVDTPLRRFFAWRGWDVFARLSLPVLMIHWAVNMTIVASRPSLAHSTFLDILVDCSATWMITYALAVPVSILLEIPMQRVIDHFLN